VILGFLRQGKLAVPFKLLMLERAIESMVGMVDDALCPEVRTFLSAIQDDQGSMLQLSPEAMDLVGVGIDDRPGVRYQATVSMSPRPTPRRWAETLGHPWRALSLSLFVGLHHLTSRTGERYPCTAPEGATSSGGSAGEDVLVDAFGRAPTLEDNDGVVPLRSQLWGHVAWAGLGDHLDVLGHFHDDRGHVAKDLRHRDWLTSGSDFTYAKFATLMDTVAAGMLA
jgi:hypothetical protein